MTYGLDQCRRCGCDMPVTDAYARDRYERERKRKPTMTEAQWRAAGWLAAPTHHQMQHPMDGLCFECKYVRGTTRFGGRRIAAIVTGILILMGGIMYVLNRLLL